MDRAELARVILDASHITGTFRLRSGQISNHYFDKYLFEAQPQLLREIAGALQPLIPPQTEILAGLELGGVPLATALALSTGLPMVFVRKQRKEYGTQKIAEGTDVAGRRLCLVEDVATTGGQVVLSAEELRRSGAVVEDALVVIQRDDIAAANLLAAGIRLHALFHMNELLPDPGR